MSDIIVVDRELLKHPAFRGLNGTAKTVYFDFLMRCKVKSSAGKHGRKKERQILNNGLLVYTYSEAKKNGIKEAAFMRALDTLIEKGFIDVAHSGSGGKKGDVSLYGISDRWKQSGKPDFEKMTRPKDARGGRGFSVYWQRKRPNIGIKNDNPTIIENDNPTIIENDNPKRKVVSMDYQKR